MQKKNTTMEDKGDYFRELMFAIEKLKEAEIKTALIVGIKILLYTEQEGEILTTNLRACIMKRNAKKENYHG